MSADAEIGGATLRSVVDAVAEAIIGFDSDGVVQLFNPAAERLLGWSASEVLGHGMSQLTVGHRRFAVADLRRQLREGKTVRRGTDVRRKDGTVVDVHLTASPILGADGGYRGAAVTLLDVSETRVARREAEESRELLQQIIDHAPNVISIKDEEGRLRFVNRMGAELMRLEPHELIGRTEYEVLPPDVARRNAEEDRLVRNDGMPHTFLKTVPLPGVGPRPFLTTKFPIPTGGVGVISSDLSGLRQAESDRAQLAALVRAAPDAVIGNDREGRITSWNPGAERMFGVRASEAIGRYYHDVVVPEAEHPRFYDLRARVLAGETITVRMGGRRVDGSEFPSEVAAAGMMLGDGTAVVVAIVRDITDLIDAEVTRGEHAARLERSNADLETFAYAASHDLQEPLRSIKLAAATLKLAAGDRLDEDEGALLDHVESAAERTSAQVAALMEGARVALGQAPDEPVPVELAVEDALSALRAAIADSKAEIEIDGPLAAVAVPRTEMALVLQNLIANALRYRREEERPRVTISGAVRDDAVEITVADNGVGLSEEDRRRIFALFVRRSPGVPGTGMGLAVSRRILQRRNGTLTAESAGTGRGSRFTIRLPAPEA
jgi:PAS domain S-box-containing protein